MTINIFDNLPGSAKLELVDVLLQQKSIRIERIVSSGQATSPDEWYDQAEHEWVVVLSGEAKILIEKPGNSPPPPKTELLHLKKGDSLLLKSHQRHRVAWTSQVVLTIWLAIFFTGGE